MDRGILERGKDGQFNPAALERPISRRQHTENIAFVQAVSRDNYKARDVSLVRMRNPAESQDDSTE